MSPKFEAVLNQAMTLSSSEKAELVNILSIPQSKTNGTNEGRRELIRAFRGKFRSILPSSEEFIAEKREETLLEER